MRGSVFVHVDPRVPGVSLPEWLRRDAQVVLQLGIDLPIPIPDLRVDENGFFGTLAFHDVSYPCEANWDAVFALVGEDGRGMVWPESLPREIAAELHHNGASRQGASRQGASRQSGQLDSERRGALHFGGAPASATRRSARRELALVSDIKEPMIVDEPATDDSVTRMTRHPRPVAPKRQLPPYLRVIK